MRSNAEAKSSREKKGKHEREGIRNGRSPLLPSPAPGKEVFANGPAASLRGPVPASFSVTRATGEAEEHAPEPAAPEAVKMATPGEEEPLPLEAPVPPVEKQMERDTAVPQTESKETAPSPEEKVAVTTDESEQAAEKETREPASPQVEMEEEPAAATRGQAGRETTEEAAQPEIEREESAAAIDRDGQARGEETTVAAPAPAAQTEAPAPAAEAEATAGEKKKEVKPGGEEQKKKEEATAPEGESQEAVKRAPATPEEDPAFQKTIGHVNRTRKKQRQHQPPAAKAGEVKQAAVLPENEQKDKNDRQQHLETMNQVAKAKEKEEKPFRPETFKRLLQSNLQDIEYKLPQSEGSAKRFKREKPLEKVRQNINAQVQAENQKVAAPIASEVKQKEPPASGLPTQAPQELQEESPGKAPRPISSEAAAPKPKYDAEISMQKESQTLDDKMAEYDMTEEQLANSNEPAFLQALDTKKQAQEEAAATPGRYREQEQKILGKARRRAGGAGRKGFGVMFGERQNTFASVFGRQCQTESEDKAKQKAVHARLQSIYNQTKIDVSATLEKLTEDVDNIFATRVKAAQKDFENRVESQLDDIYGITVIDDWIFGEDTEAIEKVFRDEKALFISKMDAALTDIANLIARKLNAAIRRIKQGRKEAQTFYDSLDQTQQRLAKEAINFFNVQYGNLEDTVREKQRELAYTLAESYKRNVDELRKSFDKIKDEVSKGWIGKAAEFIVDVGRAIAKLASLLWSVISRMGDIIGDIIAHPVRFLENLAAGIKSGFQTFVKDIDSYLAAGFFDWLRGSLGGGKIQIPEALDASGLFSLTTQILDLNYDTFRKIAVRKFGEKPVAALEKGVEIAGKGLEFFQIVRSKGLGALWEHLKAMVLDQLNAIFDKVKETILYETIKKALAHIAGMFTPVGAFIKAAQTLYRGLRFLVDNIDRIADLVNAFLDSLELAVQGNVGAIAKRVVQALQRFIVIAIDFLAKILGLGKLAAKVRRILQALRKPIVRAIEWLLEKLKPIVRRIFGAGEKIVGKVKTGVKKGVAAVVNWWKIRKGFRRGEETHEIYFSGTGKNATLMVESTPKTLAAYVADLESQGVDKTKTRRIKRLAREIDALKKEKTTKAQFEKVRKRLIKIADILADLGPNAKRPPSQVSFSTKSVLGGTIGKKMEAKPLSMKPGNTTGSGPTQESPLWKAVRIRKGKYIRGHLLNHHVHGPGNEENLTPIKKEVNEEMERRVESQVKKKVMGENEVVAYTVDVKYGSHSDRRLTAAEKTLATRITFTLHRMEKKKHATGDSPSSWEKKEEIGGISKSMPHELP